MMLSIVLGSLLFSAIAFGISSKVLGYFSSIMSFSSFDYLSENHSDKPISNFGISVFIALTLPMFIFSDLLGADIFLYPATMLLLIVLEHILQEQKLFSQKRIFLQCVILLLFILSADLPFLLELKIFSSNYANLALNSLVNLAFYLTVIHLVMYLGKKEETFRAYGLTLVSASSVFFYQSDNKFGLLISTAILTVMGLSFLKTKEFETKSLSPMFGFMLLIIAIDALNSYSQHSIALEADSIESIRAITAIFLFPAHKGGKRILSRAMNLNLNSNYRLHQILVLTVVPFVCMLMLNLNFYISLFLMLIVTGMLYVIPELFKTISANSIRIRRD
jgi:hypothetical protein